MQKYSAVFIFALVAVLAVSAEARRGTGTQTEEEDTEVSTLTSTETDVTDPDPIDLANYIIGVLTRFIQDALAGVFNCAVPCGLTAAAADAQLCIACCILNFPDLVLPAFP